MVNLRAAAIAKAIHGLTYSAAISLLGGAISGVLQSVPDKEARLRVTELFISRILAEVNASISRQEEGVNDDKQH